MDLELKVVVSTLSSTFNFRVALELLANFYQKMDLQALDLAVFLTK
jgi:hypothetical protein